MAKGDYSNAFDTHRIGKRKTMQLQCLWGTGVRRVTRREHASVDSCKLNGATRQAAAPFHFAGSAFTYDIFKH